MSELLRVGQRIYRWEVLEDQINQWVTHVKCKCECGTKRKVAVKSLRTDGSKSCGCYMREVASARSPEKIKHHINVGDVFGRLTVTNADVRTAIECDCACGTKHITQANSLASGNTRSCGCLRSENWSTQLRAMHAERGNTGISRHPAYQAWYRIAKQRRPEHRTYNPNVTICPQWEDPNVFCADVVAEIGPRPGPKGFVMRIDDSKPFAPGNILWGDPSLVAKRRVHGKYPPETRREMAQMVLDLGFKQVDVAKAYNVLPSYVSNVVKQFKDGLI